MCHRPCCTIFFFFKWRKNKHLALATVVLSCPPEFAYDCERCWRCFYGPLLCQTSPLIHIKVELLGEKRGLVAFLLNFRFFAHLWSNNFIEYTSCPARRCSEIRTPLSPFAPVRLWLRSTSPSSSAQLHRFPINRSTHR